jgi:hypothetical protein
MDSPLVAQVWQQAMIVEIAADYIPVTDHHGSTHYHCPLIGY